MLSRRVDLRSDTVTKPTEAMRSAMATAEVDDDVLGVDPTSFWLESEVAKITGKEDGLFVSSGTMGVHSRPVKNNEDGTMDIDSIEAAIRDSRGELLYPTTRLICLENSHANSGGRCLSVEYTDGVSELAKKHGLKLHIDGARIFNASAAPGVPVNRLVQAADSVSVCLSKGVGAPVGSVIVGSKSFIAKARILRKTLGGGMRRVGFICAAAFVALKENVKKLEGDHKKAKVLAEGLNQIKGLRVDVETVETNIINVDIVEGSKFTAEQLYKNLEEHGVLVVPRGAIQHSESPGGLNKNDSIYQIWKFNGTYQTKIRIVLHHQISSSDVQYTSSCFQQAFPGCKNKMATKLETDTLTIR
ncbi:putative low-specificity L-threonine aldolase 1 [Hibiscus syriacus]|uniref:Low-specificity L-threonine aldolase 1 n=1 Tax=Hibiscus syriacus TaxID=106335 RepID=A0A6A3D209_HIBSY|nr:putative low-specificity L-threonine aldolase 1 [Hibiscus syriacus]